MKKLLFIITLLTISLGNSQSLESLFKEYVQPSSTMQELKTGLEKIESFCNEQQLDKCNKAKASALYLIADKYYAIVYDLTEVDKELIPPVLLKAEAYFLKAEQLYPISNFPESQVRMLTEHKALLEN